MGGSVVTVKILKGSNVMRRGLLIAAVAAVVLVGGAAAFVWFSGGSGEPTTELAAPPVSAATTTTTPSEEPSTTTSTTTEGSAGPTAYELTGESMASFTLQEDLRGVRTTVVGTTSEVAAQLIVDPADPSTAQLGTIVINARTLATDSEFRDRAIRGEILESARDEFELITFVPTSIDGLPAASSDEFSFTVTGDLTIRTITQQVKFEVFINEASAIEVVGIATARVLRSDFGLDIPSVPNVANVTDEVDLELFFVAEPVS